MSSGQAADKPLSSSSLHSFDLLRRVISHADAAPASIAITDSSHELSFTYPQLCEDTVYLAHRILALVNERDDLAESRICILCTKGYLVPLSMFAVWTAGGLAVPLLPGMPFPEHDYMMENSEAKLVICDEAYRERAEELVQAAEKRSGECQVMLLNLEALQADRKDGYDALRNAIPLDEKRRAMMLYTSGTVRSPRPLGYKRNNTG